MVLKLIQYLHDHCRQKASLKLVVIFLLSSPISVFAEASCFAQAETYYEQVYCEIKGKSRGRSLPVFFDFKNNNQITQALLLKREAAALGITIKIPKRTAPSVDLLVPNTIQKPTARKSTTIPQAKRRPSNASDSAGLNTNCSLDGGVIQCANIRFQQTGNKRNKSLKKGVLGRQNKLGLASFKGGLNDTSRVNEYLYFSYVRYVEKMLEVGLGGVTMTYSKFAYLFYDLADKGVSFSDRFETMYTYLKKDKANMGVSEKVQLNQQLTFRDCTKLTDQIFACDNRVRNYLYLRSL